MSPRFLPIFFLVSVFTAPVRAQDMPGSSITTTTFLSPDSSAMAVRRVYDNGLGDVIQEVRSWPGSPLPDIVVRHEYDERRRPTRTWLPVTLSSGGSYVSGSSIAAGAQSQYGDTAPFSRTEYDGFLQSQPASAYKAGAQWQEGGRKVSATYSEHAGVGMYAHEDGYFYTLPDAKYLCTRTVDEDSCARTEYTDLYGRLIVSETSQGRTYYIYDINGDIIYVIPPILSAYILTHYGEESEDIPDTDEMVQKYAYIYRYDKQRHCIYKKLPGCEPIYYVYDRTGTCILTQDGKQRLRHEWTYTIPDRLGRPCISGVCSRRLHYSSEPLHPVCVYAEYDGTSTATGGYTVHNFELGPQKLHTAAYYDSYGFIGHHGVPTSLEAAVVPGFTIDASIGHGMQTGAATAVLSGGTVEGYTYSAMYYDSRYNVAQVRTANYPGGLETTCTSYSFTGKPMSVKTISTSAVTGTLEASHTYTYDSADRVASHTVTVANGGPAATATMGYEYDDLGRLSRVTRPLATSTGGDVTYTYDMHGWTTGITTGSFQEELFYAGGPGTPCFNGNISSIRWRNSNYAPKRGYRFTYDDAGRLAYARYGRGDNVGGLEAFSEGMEYDAHGNITGLRRRGKKTSSSWGVTDNLTLTYDGNRLTGVSETAPDYDFAGSFEYKGARGSQYIYDRNGALVADMSRGIAYISYDGCGNPNAIYFTDGSVTKYSYSATGQKLGVEYRVAAPNVSNAFGVEPDALSQAQTLYAGSKKYSLGGSLIFKDGMTDRYLFDGGYAKATMVSPTNYRFAFYFYNRDHLGNIREVVNSAGTVCQVINYYPSGVPYTETNSVMNAGLQPYKYNGKELDRMHGLDTYDYGARQYNPIVGRWDRMDPLCEKYYSVSPYAYCGGNPIMLIDENGDSTRVYIETNGLGHSWLSVGEGKDMVVYSYGRYNGTYKGNLLSNGDGVLLRLTGEKAKKYMDKKEREGNMSTFVIGDVKDEEVKSYVDNIFNASTTLPDGKSKEYNNDPSAHVIDEYKLLSNNCTTFVSDVLNNVGSKTLQIPLKTPSSPSSSLGIYYYEAKDRFVIPWSLLQHFNNQSHKSNTYVYKR